MVERLLEIIAPHPCSGCGKVGTLLCDYCKYDIVSEPFYGCITCSEPNRLALCEKHDFGVAGVYVVHERVGVMKRLIDQLKFQRVKAAARYAAELLDESLPLLPKDTIVTTIPTVRSHIRQRGYDHMELIAKHFAQLRILPYYPLLRRTNKASQHLLSKEERLLEASIAFTFNGTPEGLESNKNCLVLDDVITTGATITNASKLLIKRDFTVFIGALAYQPLD